MSFDPSNEISKFLSFFSIFIFFLGRQGNKSGILQLVRVSNSPLFYLLLFYFHKFCDYLGQQKRLSLNFYWLNTLSLSRAQVLFGLQYVLNYYFWVTFQ